MRCRWHCVLFFVSCFFLCSGCKRTAPNPRVENVIGTVCSVNAFEDGSEALYDSIFARLAEIDALFNVNREDSLIAQVNDAAGVHDVAVTEDFLFVLNTALHYARLSNGAFDPTIGPLVALWGINTDHARVPSEQEIRSVLACVDWKQVVVEERSGQHYVFLSKQGMALDLGGIAKGFAADEITGILKQHKVRRAIVDLGGNICVFGKKKNGDDWNIGVKNPFNPYGAPALVLSHAGGGTVVTSGVYERFFEEGGVRYHHIFDVETGMPAERNWSSVTIVAPETHSVDADALSTIGFLLGFDQFTELIGVPVVFINNDESIEASASLSGKLRVHDWQGNDILFK
ncbi:MAG: FAD:protein FMN transferase [Treponema sp.]|nr:FAD:protein FMN transferase [Treponema sp.]